MQTLMSDDGKGVIIWGRNGNGVRMSRDDARMLGIYLVERFGLIGDVNARAGHRWPRHPHYRPATRRKAKQA